MLYRIAADLVMALHLAYIVFVVVGGLLALRWPRAAWAHVPAAAWGALVVLFGWVCPLTPLEIRLRREAGFEGYAGGFIEHYVFPVIYPEGLTREIQMLLGAAVLLVNAIVYTLVWRARRG
jgi:hypothetical protein